MNSGQNFPLLKGLKVIELEGYLPVSFLGKVLHDFGADVYLIKQTRENEYMKTLSHLHEGKRSITLDLKDSNQLKILKKILQKSDILIDGYRPGVLEKLDLNPKDLLVENKKLIVVRVTGYGQEGLMHSQPGHEINYLSLSGSLDFFRNEDNKIVNPIIVLGDLFCGCLLPFYHISQALLNRSLNGGNGCVIDSSITTNLLSMSSIANKFVDEDRFYFSCVTKNYEYLLFQFKNGDNLNYNLKKICERLIIETLNLNTVSEGMRLQITRDYIDFFQLITKSVHDTKKYIKELCRMLTQEEIIKNLKKFKYLQVYPVLQYRDLLKFFKDVNIIKGGNCLNPFNVQAVDKKEESKTLDLRGNVVDVLRNMDISEEELSDYMKANKSEMKAKL
jgi:hypothetical protein